MKKLGLVLGCAMMLAFVSCDHKKKAEAEKAAMEQAEATKKKAEEAAAVAKAEADYAANTIVAKAVANENFTTLVAAVKAAGLVETLSSKGPFTLFAPVNDAFGKLPTGTVESLLKPENKGTLTSILTYHVVPGKVMAADLLKAIDTNGGTFTAKTVQGGTLTFTVKDGKAMIKDEKGNVSTIVITDVDASNGVIHAIDSVVMPK